MMIKITEKCSMGCSHCMNNALPTGKHMDFETFKKAIEFEKQYGPPFCILSGGEPTEHPDFIHFLLYALKKMPNKVITVTTNGVWMQEHYDFIDSMHKSTLQVMFQVTSVPEYYPTLIDISHPVFSLSNVFVFNRIESMYPQGRALKNHLPWKSNASKCINIRLMTHQVGHTGLNGILAVMLSHNFFCTPHIAINGDIKLGESDLCPSCSNIYKSEQEIIDDILKFKCNQCNFINKNLPIQAKKILGETYEV